MIKLSASAIISAFPTIVYDLLTDLSTETVENNLCCFPFILMLGRQPFVPEIVMNLMGSRLSVFSL